MLELLQGKLSDEVMQVVTDAHKGLFPRPKEISLQCDCPDWAVMCKHVAAVLYGVGHRLDQEPELLFTLRGVNAQELVCTDLSLPDSLSGVGEESISYDDVGDIFGIEMDEDVQIQDPTSEDRTPTATADLKKQGTSKKPSASPQKRSSTKSGSQPATSQSKHNAGNSRQNVSSGQKAAQTKGRTRKSKIPLNPPTGKKIARLRKQCVLSGPEFAQRLGVSAASVYRWENTPGTLSLHSRTLAALRQVYAEVNGE
ncbi:MAG: hypothetical protein U5L00_06205 [Desulfovermiculus sp.]|nr:hypothetical protein [Desulfovermiculus sp.]